MWELIRANRRRATVLVVVMAGLLLLVGYAVGELVLGGAGPLGLFVALVAWIVLSLVSYFSGDKVLLASSRARRIRKQDHPTLWNVVEEMCIAAGLSKIPEIYIIDEAAPNAFAAGRDPEHAVVAVTAGLLERLTRDELQGVIAHELGHVKNRDILYMTMVGVMLGTVILLADVAVRVLWYGGGTRRTSTDRDAGAAGAVLLVVALLLVVLAPFLAQLMYFALSRRREYLADASAALYTRYPEGLAGALEKIAATALPLRAANRVTAPMYIVNPLKLTERGLANLTSTHPPITERVRILRSLGGMDRLSLEAYDGAFRKVTGRPVGVVPRGSLRESQAVEARRAGEPEGDSRLERVRRTTDALWRIQDYVFLPCGCGTTLKVPPVFVGRAVACPRCATRHAVPPPATP